MQCIVVVVVVCLRAAPSEEKADNHAQSLNTRRRHYNTASRATYKAGWSRPSEFVQNMDGWMEALDIVVANDQTFNLNLAYVYMVTVCLLILS